MPTYTIKMVFDNLETYKKYLAFFLDQQVDDFLIQTDRQVGEELVEVGQ